jgi:ribosomal protein S14
MKFTREKTIRKEYVGDVLEMVVSQVKRSILGIPFLMKGRKNYRNICVVTARSRSVSKKFKVSRHIFRVLADNGIFEGIRRA